MSPLMYFRNSGLLADVNYYDICLTKTARNLSQDPVCVLTMGSKYSYPQDN